MMRCLAVNASALLLAAHAFAFAQIPSADAPDMQIARAGSQASSKGQAQYFTGSARIDPLFAQHPPMHTSGAYVTFEPGARSAWHTHPAGQVLIVTAGVGRVQRWGGPVQDTVDGKNVEWMEKVSDEQYGQ